MQGFVHPDFADVAARFGRQIARQNVGGGSVCVYHRGECVVDVWGGDRNAAGEPWEHDTMALSWSTTKGVASTALHMLADRQMVDYEAPVCRYWPEFAQNGKGAITVREVMAHEAGLHRLAEMIDTCDDMLDWDRMTAGIEAAAPAYEPGTRSGYHALTYGNIVGEIVRRVSGKAVYEFVQVEIADPLGVDGLNLWVPPDQRHRVAQLTKMAAFLDGGRPMPAGLKRASAHLRELDAVSVPGMGSLFWSPRVFDGVVPSANGMFTARSLARMYAAIAEGGTLDGVRLLSPDTVDAMGKLQSRRVDAVVAFPMHWRMGFHLVGTPRGILPYAFGHWGYGGSGAWADPSRRLAVAMVVNRVAGTPFGDQRLAIASGAAVGAADKR
ncbi:MAG: beta-lactamase family protein [Acidimicrobiia bacterium]|nr:beta-lactamase family protein [Acidimicrobiia bacterium]